MRPLSFAAAILSAVLMSGVARAQQAGSPAPPPAPPYGAPITLEQAKKVAAAAEAESRKNGWTHVVAIVEPNGALVYLEKMDGTQYAAVNVATDKAVASAIYRRPTTAFDAGLRGNNLYLLTLRNMNAVPGGLPIVFQGKIIGAIGTSGGSGPQDVQVAEAGLAALK